MSVKVSNKKPYVVIISGAHLQTTRTFWTASPIPIANDVFKSIAAAPLGSGSSDVTFHGVTLGKVVP